MSKGNTFENEMLQHVFENADIALIGDATGLRGSTAAGLVFISLHTANPGEGGSQNTSEANYTGYARASVARTDAQWTITNNTCVNANAITFATCTGGSNDIIYFAVGTTSSGAGKILYYGATGSTLSVSNNIVPQMAAGALVITES